MHSSPVLLNKKIFFGSWDGKLYCLDPITGKKLWEYEIGEDINCSITISENRLYIGADDGKLYCLNEKNH